jgi:phage shock protein C
VNDIHDRFRQQGLVRPADQRVLAGVCAGLGRRFGISPWPARLLFLLILMVAERPVVGPATHLPPTAAP